MTNQPFWAITSYFNPGGYRSRGNNYKIFRKHLNVPLITIELSFNGDFDLHPSDADVIVQKQSRSVMWQKERLLNIALRYLPETCDQVAWLDCDIIFKDPEWSKHTCQALEHYPLVQPFQKVYELSPGKQAAKTQIKSTDPDGYSIAYLLETGEVSSEILSGNMRVLQGCNSGLAWAAQRELLERDSFYDACVVGSGNRAMVCGALGRPEEAIQYLQMNSQWQKHYLAWADKHYESVGGKIGYVEGSIYHLWHGNLQNRQYQDRHRIFKAYDFDPEIDLALANNLCWLWNSNKPAMHGYVAGYFGTRLEDG